MVAATTAVDSAGNMKQNHLTPSLLTAFAFCLPVKNLGRWLKVSMALNALLLLSLIYEKNRHIYRQGTDTVNGFCSETSPEVTVEDDSRPCSDHGYIRQDDSAMNGVCKCHACFRGESCSERDPTCTIDLDHGDPTMFESYWQKHGGAARTVILGWQRMSYFAESESICWFLEQKLANEIRSLHRLVGNAQTEGRHIVVGTGSTQLFQAALYALSPADGKEVTSVVSAAPYYSSYPAVTDYLKSGRYRWGGDAREFKQRSEEETYIELVTSPNNPDGRTRKAVTEGKGGRLVYDLAYYWPHYTPITQAEDEEIMLFTVSKSTGHAGTRIGWALVREEQTARKMTKFIELNTIGVSQDAQLRAAKVLGAVVRSHSEPQQLQQPAFFHHGSSLLLYRWTKLRSTIATSNLFSLPDFDPAFCTFFARTTTPLPAFAWLRCNQETDCQAFMKQKGIIARSGRDFGADPKHVRMSMLDRSEVFEMLLDRLAAIQQQQQQQQHLQQQQEQQAHPP